MSADDISPEQCERLAASVKHYPLCPPRPGTPGEGIYLSLWKEWAEANPIEWFAIWCTNDRVGQRQASIGASFMVFMGCNCGYSFTLEAERLAKDDHYRERAFLRAWADHNSRSRGVNSGLRTIEYMLAEKHPIVHDGIGHGVDWSLVPDVTMADTDAVESMVRWWAGPAAKTLREIATPAIESANRKAWSGMFGVAAQEGGA